MRKEDLNFQQVYTATIQGRIGRAYSTTVILVDPQNEEVGEVPITALQPVEAQP